MPRISADLQQYRSLFSVQGLAEVKRAITVPADEADPDDRDATFTVKGVTPADLSDPRFASREGLARTFDRQGTWASPRAAGSARPSPWHRDRAAARWHCVTRWGAAAHREGGTMSDCIARIPRPRRGTRLPRRKVGRSACLTVYDRTHGGYCVVRADDGGETVRPLPSGAVERESVGAEVACAILDARGTDAQRVVTRDAYTETTAGSCRVCLIVALPRRRKVIEDLLPWWVEHHARTLRYRVLDWGGDDREVWVEVYGVDPERILARSWCLRCVERFERVCVPGSGTDQYMPIPREVRDKVRRNRQGR